ncbi:hypothetical protein IscW_ISCW009031 [Ixodes scapularis]|uniref:Uncharacterized protein n=1 Tax=Ixodes scapularis TaxID=6945 RepID=B7Q380_IXOSC|nr:hypothetical protein IscW_ISCW009031 [Ixodes scapularis]|eukprot:XP_002411178.1 hypothetical protein IscW_ISCW009031 [Ixodes scapularis]
MKTSCRAGDLLPEMPAEAVQVIEALPLIQQIETIQQVNAIKSLKQGGGSSGGVPPFLPIVLALHYRSNQQQSTKSKLKKLLGMMGR